MLVLVLPESHTVRDWQPNLIEAKAFNGRIAVFWLLYPSASTSGVEAIWGIQRFEHRLDIEVERLNRAFALARKREKSTDYDVALSFAGEDRAYVEQVAEKLLAIALSFVGRKSAS